jgi:DhnA family fructose-bisphosphate aldolase class Ia
MTAALRGTDPGSVSRLGGLLRSTAATVCADVSGLSPETPIAQVCLATAGHVDAIGAALQVHAQELSEAAAALARLQERAAAAGLVLIDWTVTEPFGVVPADVAARRATERPQLQAQADRLASRLARTRAQLARQLTQARAQLAAAAAAAR